MIVPEPLVPARAARQPDKTMARRELVSAPSGSDEDTGKPGAEAGLMARLGRLWERDRFPDPAALRPLFAPRLTDVAANRLAHAWCQAYTAADGKIRRTMLGVLAAASAAQEQPDEANGRLFRRFNNQPEGLRFLVDLRADMLRWRKQVSGLQALDKTLEGLLSAWFDVGLLDLRRLTWDSPASLLEKLIVYEAVHAIQSWDDLKHRVAEDRRCYAFFHPQMPDVPLIFVEVAFAPQMADDVQTLLDTTQPPQNLDKARWAVFYSISNTQPGLRGISFGNFLLKRVVDQLLSELPKLKSFATLSPIPGFADWLGKLNADEVEDIVRDKARDRARRGVPDGARWLARLQKAAASPRGGGEVVQRAGMKLAAAYLQSMKGGAPLDPVARFHLGNGARIERINWGADRSPKGLAQSAALMVNYLYELDELDDNLARLNAGKPAVSRLIARIG
ncbi:malonyl-CoA decarboxylase domain-containing protein [Bordetella genomosp. 11]|uniref:Malonyl-CoA decarboxylase n=1 Tax=Bordetella genomosp. 11 TaxID=1416808 RepID=A0A261UEV6_9BORD|nr:malonyl-CoA decarboxylase family protein [Bordetella genomosp. 11]OZI59760.1 malonyl-CoA decarboxylase [Bordetella genomosp. 11]